MSWHNAPSVKTIKIVKRCSSWGSCLVTTIELMELERRLANPIVYKQWPAMQIDNGALVRQKVGVHKTQKRNKSCFHCLFHGYYSTVWLWREAKSFSCFFGETFAFISRGLNRGGSNIEHCCCVAVDTLLSFLKC